MDTGKSVTLIISLLIAAIVAGLVFVPIVDSIGDPTVTYADDSTTTAIGGSATTVTWVSGDNGGIFTGGVADCSITIGAYAAAWDVSEGTWTLQNVAGTETYATSTGANVRLANTTGTVWFNYQGFDDSTTITGVTLSAAGCVGATYTSTVATAHTTSTTVVTLFGVMGLLVVMMLIWIVAKFIQGED